MHVDYNKVYAYNAVNIFKNKPLKFQTGGRASGVPALDPPLALMTSAIPHIAECFSVNLHVAYTIVFTILANAFAPSSAAGQSGIQFVY